MKYSVFVLTLACFVLSFQTEDLISQDSSKISQHENETKDITPYEKKLEDYAKIIDSDDVDAKLKALDEMFGLESKSTTPIVIKALKDKDPSVRAKAANLLGRLRDKSATTALMDVIFDTDENVRRYAAEFMGEQQVVEAIPNLIKLLMDESRRVAERAHYALYRIGKPAIPALIQALKHENITVRKFACETLQLIKDKSAVQALIEATNEECKDEKGPNIRIYAIRALGYIGDKIAVDKIGKYLKDNNLNVYREAIEALGKISGDKATTLLIKEYKAHNKTNLLVALGETRNKMATPILIEALKSDQWYARYEAAKALIKMNDKSAVPALIEAIDDENKTVRRAVLSAIINFKVENVEKLLRDAFVKETDNDNKAFIANRLVYFNVYAGLEEEIVKALVKELPESAFHSTYQSRNYLEPFGELASDALIKILETTHNDQLEERILNLLEDFTGEKVVKSISKKMYHRDRRIRYKVVQSLGQIADKKALPYLEEYFNSTIFAPDSNFAEALFNIEGEKAVELLDKLFDKIGESQLKIQVASYLVRLQSDDSERFYNYLLETTKSWNLDICTSACWYLGEIGDNKAIPHLVEVIKTKPLETLAYAFKALQEIGDESVVPTLMKIFEDPKYVLQKRAMLTKLRLCAGIVDKQNYINLLKEAEPYYHLIALRGLSKYEDVDLGQYNFEKLNSNNEQNIKSAMYFFGDTKDEKYIEIIKPFIKSENDNIRHTAIATIGRIGGAKSELFLLNGLIDKEEDIRQASATFIMRNKQISAENTLSIRFKEEDSNNVKITIAGALYAINPEKYADMAKFVATTKYRTFRSAHPNYWLIGELRLKDAVPMIIKSLDSIDLLDRTSAAQALASLGDKSAIPALTELFDRSTNRHGKMIRYKYAIALAKLGYEDIDKILLDLLNSTSNHIREEAVKALGEYADNSVIPKLQKVMNEDYSYLVREAAKEAINNIQSRCK